MIINRVEFKSKAALEKFVSQMLQSYEPGTIITGTNKEFLEELFQYHPRASEKIGIGIKEIMVRIDPVWKKTKQFWIIRTDGTGTDISYKKPIYGEPSTKMTFAQACRSVVIDDIIQFKLQALKTKPICPHRGIMLDFANSSVDHVAPKTFNFLVDSFIKINNIDINRVNIIGEMRREFADPGLKEKFYNYHKQEAVLELVYHETQNKECKTKSRCSHQTISQYPQCVHPEWLLSNDKPWLSCRAIKDIASGCPVARKPL